MPHALNAEYYAQRAAAGLIVTEATQIAPEGKGYIQTPGIYSAEQVDGRRLVTDAVHAKGGRIFCQLWHVGRISHVSLQPGSQSPVAPSAIQAKAQTCIAKNHYVDVSPPRALGLDEIPRVIDDYAKAASNARDAGFDGVELHARNGYLIDQFLRNGSNKRTDAYGGSLENRTRLLAEVLAVLTRAFPPERIGVRFSPFSSFGDMSDSDPMTMFAAALDRANDAGLGYVHVVEGETGGPRTLPLDALSLIRTEFRGTYMANNGYNRELAIEAVQTGAADLIAFGRLFLANPDLVARLERNAPLNEPDPATFYGGDAKGYTDYPTLEKLAV